MSPEVESEPMLRYRKVRGRRPKRAVERRGEDDILVGRKPGTSSQSTSEADQGAKASHIPQEYKIHKVCANSM
jgi:hypothetical protein